MLRLTSLLALLCTGLLLPSCTNESNPALPVSGIDVEELVEAYNSELPPAVLEDQGAFVATGTVTDAGVRTNAEGKKELTFVFTDAKATRTVEFQFTDEVEFPEEIDRAKVVYLGHQMIIADLDGEFFVHLLVPKGDKKENLLPSLPYIIGSGLELDVERAVFSGVLPRR